MTNSVIFEVRQHVGIITLNEPDRLNAIDAEMGAKLDDCFVRAGTDPNVRVILLTGNGRGFCAGASFNRLEELNDAGSRGLNVNTLARDEKKFACFDAPPQFLTRYTIPLALPKPVIAAINGPAAGAGFALALACDIRLANHKASFVANFAKLGLVAESVVPAILPRIVGHGVASDILLSSQKVGSQQAFRMGLVSRIFENDSFSDDVFNLSREIAEAAAPSSLKFIKRQLQHAWTAPVTDTIDLAIQGTIDAIDSPDFSEAMAALRENRRPKFSSL